MRCDAWYNVQRVLVVRLDNLGDVVMLSPALRSLRSALPDASITLMASPAGVQVAPMLPWVDRAWSVEALWQDASHRMPLDPERELLLVEGIRERRFDAALIFTSFSQSPHPAAYACYLAGVPLRVGQSKEFAGGVLSHAAPSLPDGVYQVDRNLHLLEHAGIEIDRRQLELTIPADAAAQADALLASHGISHGQPFVALAPGASCAARRYDALRYAEVVRRLQEATALPVVLLGSAKERALTALVRQASEIDAIDLAGETGVCELAAVIARSSLVIANNSGSIHIASAFGRPAVVMYSGTDYETQWAPKTPSVVLRRPTHCSPCYGFVCAQSMECLDIAPSEVVAAALDLLAAAGVTTPRERIGV